MSENNLAVAVRRATGVYMLEMFNSYTGLCGRFDARTMRFLLREQEEENDEVAHQLDDQRSNDRSEIVIPRQCKHRQYLGHLMTGDASEQIFTMNVVEDTRASRRRRYTAQIEANNNNGIGWVLRMWKKPDFIAVPSGVTRRSSMCVFDRCRSIFASLCSCCSAETIEKHDDTEQTSLLRHRTDRAVQQDRRPLAGKKGIPDRVFLLLPLSEIQRHVETISSKEREIREKTRSLRMKNIPQHLHEQLN